MLDINQQLRGQLIPLRNMKLVLPNTCIAEVLGASEIQPTAAGPAWFLGTLPWRGRQIPIISFEALSGGTCHELTGKSRIAVLNCLNGNPLMPFYGMAIQGVPHLVTLNTTNINSVTCPDVSNDMALQQVMIGEQTALIPNLEKLEALVQQSQAGKPAPQR